ncbi:MAG: hypothetical protein FMNOHCHN_00356 [Ignavibacteriaceae bacterium]|nr:hypothetical protein [Ignavibacteriaceae bacterium]
MSGKIFIALNHPAHYHLFKNLKIMLVSSGYEVGFFIKNKEILEKLMITEGEKYFKYNVTRFKKNTKLRIIIGGLLDLLIQDFTLLIKCLKNRPLVMLGTDIAIAHIGWFTKIRSFVFNEDDFDVNKSFCKFAYPFASHIISPNLCDVGKYSFKKIGYEGYQKLSYLHPKRFNPSRERIKEFVGEGKYFIIRLVSLSAGHDIEQDHNGLNYQDLRRLTELLKPLGQVFVSSEKTLPEEFNHFELKTPVNVIHDMMFYSTMFISDSQSMTVECCMLGVPNIRINTFVGKISVLEELEKKYELTIGIHPNNKDLLFGQVHEFLNDAQLHDRFQTRRLKMLSEKIDVTSFVFDLITA